MSRFNIGPSLLTIVVLFSCVSSQNISSYHERLQNRVRCRRLLVDKPLNVSNIELDSYTLPWGEALLLFAGCAVSCFLLSLLYHFIRLVQIELQLLQMMIPLETNSCYDNTHMVTCPYGHVSMINLLL